VSAAPKSPKETEPAPATAASPAPAEEKPERKEKEKPAKGKAPKEGKESKGKARAGAAPGAAAGGKPIPDNPNFRYIVRLAGTDLNGRRPAALALTGVSGVGLRLAEVVCRLSQVNPHEMIGNLPEPTVDGIEVAIQQLPTRVPAWMLNHTNEHGTGESRHFIGAELETADRDDVNQMKMIRSYRGVRHERGQKVRGQRTRSNGRTGMAAGVLKKAAKEAAQKAAQEAAAPAPTPAPAEKKV
jgi:small subunit ribosomal protein S13